MSTNEISFSSGSTPIAAKHQAAQFGIAGPISTRLYAIDSSFTWTAPKCPCDQASDNSCAAIAMLQIDLRRLLIVLAFHPEVCHVLTDPHASTGVLKNYGRRYPSQARPRSTLSPRCLLSVR